MKAKTRTRRPAPPPRRHTGTITTASIIGGLGVGAALMYLLDPEAEARRRRAIADHAGDAMSSAGERIGQGWERVSDSARHMGSSVAEVAVEKFRAGERIGRQMADDASETASSWLESAREKMNPSAWAARARQMLPVQKRTDPTMTVLAGIGCLAVGIGGMYMLDPAKGRARRAFFGDKAGRWLREIGDFSARTGRHVRNRLTGTYHDARAMMSHEEITDVRLAERVRSALGRIGTGAGSVGVAADNGRIVLTGRCAPTDVDSVISAVGWVRGVSDIVNEMEVQEANA